LEVGYESMKEQNKKGPPTDIAAGSPLVVITTRVERIRRQRLLDR
jgi:hypothetical protein